ncbi:MAG TPA: RCC1 domain-containing protein [Myxococcota bacterium]|nr:RCC1 domain-containing protein [Myxococcota bacterium]
MSEASRRIQTLAVIANMLTWASAAEASGPVAAWGFKASGLLAPPSLISGVGGTASSITAGDGYSCAIQAGTGAVICWGNNVSGQATPPAWVDGTAGAATAIAAGESYSCSIQAGSGAVVCWGATSMPPPASVDGTAGAASAIATSYQTCAIQAGTARSSAGETTSMARAPRPRQ